MIIAYLISLLGFITDYYQWIYLILMFEVFSVSVIFTLELPKRKLYWLRLIGCFVMSIALAYLFALIRTNLNLLGIKMILSMLIYSFLVFILCFLTTIRGTDGVFVTIATLTARETVDNLFIFILLALRIAPNEAINIFNSTFLNYLFYDVIHIILQLSLYLIIRKKIMFAHDLQISKTIVFTTFILLVTSIVAKNIASSTSIYNITYYLSIGLIILLCFGVFILITVFLQENRHRQEKVIIARMLETEGKQYESLKLNMEVINTKAHDIKHQLEYLQNKVAEEDLLKLKESIQVYDKTWNTGNTVIDTLLYDRNLKCNAKGIRITCLCDPSAIDKMNQMHLYYLVANIIDNAMEAVELLPEDERLISLNITKDGERTIIEESNYFSGERNIFNNKLYTNKKDKANHGYGLKSIKFISKLYDGKVNLDIKDNMFFISVSFIQKELADEKI